MTAEVIRAVRPIHLFTFVSIAIGSFKTDTPVVFPKSCDLIAVSNDRFIASKVWNPVKGGVSDLATPYALPLAPSWFSASGGRQSGYLPPDGRVVSPDGSKIAVYPGAVVAWNGETAVSAPVPAPESVVDKSAANGTFPVGWVDNETLALTDTSLHLVAWNTQTNQVKTIAPSAPNSYLRTQLNSRPYALEKFGKEQKLVDLQDGTASDPFPGRPMASAGPSGRGFGITATHGRLFAIVATGTRGAIVERTDKGERMLTYLPHSATKYWFLEPSHDVGQLNLFYQTDLSSKPRLVAVSIDSGKFVNTPAGLSEDLASAQDPTLVPMQSGFVLFYETQSLVRYYRTGFKPRTIRRVNTIASYGDPCTR